MSAKVAQRQIDRVVSGELNRRAAMARDKLIVPVQRRRLIRLDKVRKFVLVERIKRKAGELSGRRVFCSGLWSIALLGKPAHECFTPALTKLGSVSLQLLHFVAQFCEMVLGRLV